MSKLNELSGLGQSVWFDFIQRSHTRGGKLQELINLGVRGVTSNPTIFEKAITGGSDYDDLIRGMTESGASSEQIYEALSTEDVGDAADLFMPLYKASDGSDGFVSIEVNPKLAYDVTGTVEEGKRLFSLLDRPNIMIKVPATPEGATSVRELISEGVNVNATLMFSEKHYREIVEAYLQGLEVLKSRERDLSGTASVASFFVSRVDAAVDEKLTEVGRNDLLGKISIANARNVYRIFLELFSGGRWDSLASSGAAKQRVLWASTGTKNPEYPDTLYVDELIGDHTVNTLPPSTLDSFLDHGTVRETLPGNMEDSENLLDELAECGISLEEVTENLQEKGVQSFADSYDNLLEAISEKQKLVKDGQS